ncbi:MAG TPA: peroxiredoxin [Steroidobacteraceae bacterium]
MKHILAAGLLSTALALLAFPATAALAPGEVAPDFSAKASLAGKEFDFSLAAALAKGPVVVYFYPSAYTGGCNIEAHTFAENRDKFDAVGATIIGVSRDSIARLNEFSADPDYCAGRFPVASDADGRIAEAYGLKAMELKQAITDTRGRAVEHALTERATFVINRDGKIIATMSSSQDKISPADHVTRSLAAVTALQIAKPN